MAKYTSEDLAKMQAWPLERKIQVAQTRIIEWFERWDGNVHVSFSGGKDSTVLLDLVRRAYPEVPAVFCDTGLEYPQIRSFVSGVDNVIWLRPAMTFPEVIKKHGYPVVSKEVSQAIDEYRRAKIKGKISCREPYFNGEVLTKEGKTSCYNMDKWKYLLDAPFKISDRCCNEMKKKPFHKYERETKSKTFVGTMATESRRRRTSWIIRGCNAFDSKRPISKPLSVWTENDVLQYLKITGLPYCDIYGEIKDKGEIEGQESFWEVVGSLETTGAKRTGCAFCAFGCHLENEPNRFQRMKKENPAFWNYCINGGEFVDGLWQPSQKGLGMGFVLEYMGVKFE